MSANLQNVGFVGFVGWFYSIQESEYSLTCYRLNGPTKPTKPTRLCKHQSYPRDLGFRT